MTMQDKINNAVAYVKSELSEGEQAQLLAAMVTAFEQRCTIEQVNINIVMRVTDLIEEYTQDNNLNADWWQDLDIEEFIGYIIG